MQQFVNQPLQSCRLPQMPEQYLVDKTYNYNINRDGRKHACFFKNAFGLKNAGSITKGNNDIAENGKITEEPYDHFCHAGCPVQEHEPELHDNGKPGNCCACDGKVAPLHIVNIKQKY